MYHWENGYDESGYTTYREFVVCGYRHFHCLHSASLYSDVQEIWRYFGLNHRDDDASIYFCNYRHKYELFHKWHVFGIELSTIYEEYI